MTELLAARRYRAAHLAEDLPFRYAVILAKEFTGESRYSGQALDGISMQEEVIRNMANAGLEITVMQSTAETKECTVLLVNATKIRLVQEWKRLCAERANYVKSPEKDSGEQDEILEGRPAWNRDSEQAALMRADNYDETKWEPERELSYADEILCIQRIISGTLEPRVGSLDQGESSHLKLFRGAGLDAHRPLKERQYPIVQEVFPLQDDKFVHEFLQMMNPRQEYKTSDYLGDMWFVEELRYHFGERVAYYYAFQQLYTDWLKPVALIGLFFWIIFCVFGPSAILYWRIIAIYGFLVSTIWVPAMLRYWQQRTQELNTRWGLENWSEDLDLNPDFDWGANHENSKVIRREPLPFQARQAFFLFADRETLLLDKSGFAALCRETPGVEYVIDSDSKRDSKFAELDIDNDGLLSIAEFTDWIERDELITPNLGVRPHNPPFRKWWTSPINYTIMFFFFLIFFILNLGFVYWYVYGVLIDVCEDGDSRSWPSCFNTQTAKLGSGRWMYIALQGVALGIFLDIILEGIVTAIVEGASATQNKPTMKAQEDYYIGHVFFYLWSGWFMWFSMLAFVYIPFGRWIQTAQKEMFGDKYVNDWVPGLIAMDTALVTPLIVTQLLKVLTDTFIPYVLRKISSKAKLQSKGSLTLGHTISKCPLEDVTRVMHEDESLSEQETEALLTADQTSCTADILTVLAKSDLADRVYVTKSFPTWERNHSTNKMTRAWKTATHIVEEGKLGTFNMFGEMLRPVIQFSYVANFSAVWPLTALCAYLNNVFEVKGDAFKMLRAQRRSVPRKVNGIGSWYSCLVFAGIMGIFFMVGMICVASNGLEAFLYPDACDLHDDQWTMRPNIGCIGGSGLGRVAAILILEHIGLLTFFMVYINVPDKSKHVEAIKVMDYMAKRRNIEDEWLQSVQQGK